MQPALLLRLVVFFVVCKGGCHCSDGALEFWQVLVDCGLQDGVGCVEVAVGQVITHPGDLAPGDRGLCVEQIGGQSLDGLTDLEQPDPDGVEDQPVGESSSLQVRADRVDSGLDIASRCWSR
jgi:hypothetical protein